MNTSQQVWKVYSFTTWGSNGHSVLKEMLYDSLKKVHRRELPKALTTITWLCIFASYHAIFPTMQAAIAFIVYQQKANIFNFLGMAAKFVWFILVPYHIA